MEAAHRRLYVARPLGGRCGLQQEQPKRQGEVAKASHGAPVLPAHSLIPPRLAIATL